MSTTIPAPLRAAAGLAAITIDEARRLPSRLIGLPVSAASTALQASLKVQQQYADLIVRGDELLSGLKPEPEEAPSWATFDDETADADTGAGNGLVTGRTEDDLTEDDLTEDVAVPEEDLAADTLPATETSPGDIPSAGTSAAETSTAGTSAAGTPPVTGTGPVAGTPVEQVDPAADLPLPGYDALTVPQLRARLRRLTAEQVQELLDYEGAHAARPPYLTMLANRLETLRSA